MQQQLTNEVRCEFNPKVERLSERLVVFQMDFIRDPSLASDGFTKCWTV
jgi:hypothetical protein